MNAYSIAPPGVSLPITAPADSTVVRNETCTNWPIILDSNQCAAIGNSSGSSYFGFGSGENMPVINTNGTQVFGTDDSPWGNFYLADSQGNVMVGVDDYLSPFLSCSGSTLLGWDTNGYPFLNNTTGSQIFGCNSSGIIMTGPLISSSAINVEGTISGGGGLAVSGAITFSLSGIPAGDPHSAGLVWRNGTALQISLG